MSETGHPDTGLLEAVRHESRLTELSLIKIVGAMVVDSQESYDNANAIIDKCDVALSRIAEVHDPVIKAAHDAHKVALEAKRKLADPIAALRREASAKMAAWFCVEQARAAEERRVAAEAARKEAEERRLREAEALSKAGLEAAALAALDAPLEFRAADAPIALPRKTAGVSYRETWRAEVVDLRSLVKAVAEGAPLTYVTANLAALNAVARALHGSQEIPGVRFVSDTVQVKRRSA